MSVLKTLQKRHWSLKQATITAAAVLLAVVPIVIYYRIIFRYAINVPFEDDYDSGIAFISNYFFHSTSFSQKINYVFSLHNEHRIIFNRLVFLIDYTLEKQLNFRTIILFGNLSLIFILFLLYNYLTRKQVLVDKWISFLPIPFLLFQLHFWELMTWGMASVQNLYVLVFVLLSLYTLSYCQKNPGWFWISLLSAIAATFTSGNGIFVFIIGIALLVLLKAYGLLRIWLITTIGVAIIYFWQYKSPNHHPSIASSATSVLSYFFTLIGCLFSARPIPSIVAGIGVFMLFVGVFSWLIYKRQLLNQLFPLSLICFLYLTCISLTITRSGFGIEQAMSSRYGILPVLLLISLYLAVLKAFTSRSNQFLIVGTTFLVAVYLNQYNYRQNLPKLKERAAYFKESCILYHTDKEKVILFRVNSDAKFIFNDGISKGIYQVPLLRRQ